MQQLNQSWNGVTPERARALIRRGFLQHGRRGMNLLEIMIVVAIIVVLVSVLGYAALQVNENFKRSETELRMSQIANVVQSEVLLLKKTPKSLSDVDGLKPDQVVDGWGNPFEFVADGRDFDIISYGRDGQEGGTGLDADISWAKSKSGDEE